MLVWYVVRGYHLFVVVIVCGFGVWVVWLVCLVNFVITGFDCLHLYGLCVGVVSCFVLCLNCWCFVDFVNSC